MPEITLRVTDSPRWNSVENRWQPVGENVSLAAPTEADLWEQYVQHAEHCREVVAGEIPRAPWDRMAPAGMDRRAPRGPVRRPVEKQVSAVQQPAPKGMPAIGYVCEECGTAFRSRKGIELHRRNAHPQTATEE